jgi:hypothetical protein
VNHQRRRDAEARRTRLCGQPITCSNVS